MLLFDKDSETWMLPSNRRGFSPLLRPRLIKSERQYRGAICWQYREIRYIPIIRSRNSACCCLFAQLLRYNPFFKRSIQYRSGACSKGMYKFQMSMGIITFIMSIIGSKYFAINFLEDTVLPDNLNQILYVPNVYF